MSDLSGKSEMDSRRNANFVRTSIKHGIQSGMIVQFGILQEGDKFRHPDHNGARYLKVGTHAVPAGSPHNNAVNKDYKAETFTDDMLVTAKAAYQQRDNFPAGQIIRFGELKNGDEFIINNSTYRKRTDWYEIHTFVDASGHEGCRFVKSSANAINEAVLYPWFDKDEEVVFESDATEDLSQYNWISDID